MLHQPFQLRIRVINKVAHTVHNLRHIVRGDIGGHTNCNSSRTVDEQVWEPRGEYHRLFETVIIVGGIIYGILVNIREHV